MLRFVDSFLKYQNNHNLRSANSRGGQRQTSRGLSYQNLEARCLLAGISFDLDTGGILIEGGTADDIAQVQLTQDGSMVLVSLSGFANETFAVSDVSTLRFEAGLGNDQFSNFTSIPSTVLGGNGDDVIFSGFGDDSVFGGAGNDEILGSDGNDFLSGNSGNDVIIGGLGNDELLGGSNDDELRGGSGDDMIFGQEGADLLFGDQGADQILGGDDIDEIFGGQGDDMILGGTGFDTIRGGDGDDTIRGDDGNDQLFGGNGVDTIQGNGGEDLIFGGTQDDDLSGGDGDDTLVGQTGNDTIDGGTGEDLIFGQAGNDTLAGGDGNDQILGDNGNDIVDGGLGNDRVLGGLGDDILSGSLGLDLIFGGTGFDQIFGEEGNDTLIGNAGDDLIDAGEGDDIVFGDLGDDEIRGGAGEDSLFGQSGSDVIYGADGDDLVLGGDGNDTVFGGGGDDLIFGSAGDDNLYGQEGVDTVLGQAGNDGNFGGVEGGDTIIDRVGRNRFIDFGNDVIAGATATDAILVFRNGSDEWTNQEVETLDQGFFLLTDRTQSTRILQATLTNEPLVFVKDSTVAPLGEIAVSSLVSTVVPVAIPGTNSFEFETIVERTLTFGDWDESDQSLNDFYISQVPGLISLDWAGPDAVANVISSQGSFWDAFLLQSGWTQDRPGPIEFFEVSGDEQWFYQSNALFADPISQSTENPTADFQSIWNLSFATGAQAEAQQALLVNKLSQIDNLFTLLSFF